MIRFRPVEQGRERAAMYWIFSILLLANWAFGVASGAAVGPWVHLLLAAGLVALALALVDAARRPPARRRTRSSSEPRATREERSA